ncbi:hypothetical protein KKG22_03285 [Patescibacteria group bacterium]|nr:hypothetical protein [Patescibacteria group bacterium]MBU1721173.1 hypothetical protein [Patescibacteria group bacterium]MBU1900897.1 hypothetical protein [Patescibacteria group bacterium]
MINRFKPQLLCTNHRGFAALLLVVVVGAAALIMAFSASFLGINDLEMGYTMQQGRESLAFAEGCVHEGLEQLRQDSNYNGSTLNDGVNSCIIEVVDNGGGLQTVTVNADIDDHFYTTLVVGVDLNNGIDIVSWTQE